METCPHGARLVIVDGEPVVFVDECVTCETVLADTGFAGKVVPRETVPASA